MGYKTGQKNYPGDIAPEPLRGLSMSDTAWAYRPKPMLHELSLKKSPIKNHTTLFGSSTGSNITRLHKAQQITHLETSSITNINYILQKTIPHPCNSSSYPQARRSIEATHSFNFSIVTPLVNMSSWFVDP